MSDNINDERLINRRAIVANMEHDLHKFADIDKGMAIAESATIADLRKQLADKELDRVTARAERDLLLDAVSERDQARAELMTAKIKLEDAEVGIDHLKENLKAAIRERDEARKEVERLRELTGKLPKTADDYPIFIGQNLFAVLHDPQDPEAFPMIVECGFLSMTCDGDEQFGNIRDSEGWEYEDVQFNYVYQNREAAEKKLATLKPAQPPAFVPPVGRVWVKSGVVEPGDLIHDRSSPEGRRVVTDPIRSCWSPIESYRDGRIITRAPRNAQHAYELGAIDEPTAEKFCRFMGWKVGDTLEPKHKSIIPTVTIASFPEGGKWIEAAETPFKSWWSMLEGTWALVSRAAPVNTTDEWVDVTGEMKSGEEYSTNRGISWQTLKDPGYATWEEWFGISPSKHRGRRRNPNYKPVPAWSAYASKGNP